MQEAIDKSKLLRKKFFWEKVKNDQSDSGHEWYYLYDRKKAKAMRDAFFDELKVVLGASSFLGKDSLEEIDMHWFEEAKQIHQVQKTLNNYHELEQLRFIEQHAGKFHPEVLDDFLAVLETIFEIRAPPLLHVLRQYVSMTAKELDGQAFHADKADKNKIANRMSKVEIHMNADGEIISTEIMNDPTGEVAKAFELGNYKVVDAELVKGIE